MDPLNVLTKFEVRSFTHSWNNSDWNFGWGCEPPILGKRRPKGVGIKTHMNLRCSKMVCAYDTIRWWDENWQFLSVSLTDRNRQVNLVHGAKLKIGNYRKLRKGRKTKYMIGRDVPDFGSGSGKSGIRPFFGNPAKSGSGQNFHRIWPDLGQLSRMVIFLTTANSAGILYLCE